MSTDQAAVDRPTRRVLRISRGKRSGPAALLRDVVIVVVVAVLVSFLVKTFVVRAFYIPSQSMENTLMVQDRILVDELTPRFTGYSRGDIIVFKDPGGWLNDTRPHPSSNPLRRDRQRPHLHRSLHGG